MIILDILTHQVFLSVVVANSLTQAWKLVDNTFRNNRFEWRVFFSIGGMPSSHATFVCSLATTIGLVEGFTSNIFFVSAGLAAIVMRDALGVRRAVDNLTETVNSIIKHKKIGVKAILKITGHTPVQVIVGSLIGIVIPVLMNYLYI